jgi:hypothetical protein
MNFTSQYMSILCDSYRILFHCQIRRVEKTDHKIMAILNSLYVYLIPAWILTLRRIATLAGNVTL